MFPPIQESIAAEVAVTPLSKEFKVTIDNPAIATVDPAWSYPLVLAASTAKASAGIQRWRRSCPRCSINGEEGIATANAREETQRKISRKAAKKQKKEN
jgi:hypothetical protein